MPIAPLDEDGVLLEVTAVEPLEGRVVRLTLSDGTVVERDLTDLLAGGGLFTPIAADESARLRVGIVKRVEPR